MNGANYQGRIGPSGWGQSIPTPHHKGSFAKGEKPELMGENLKTDPGGRAYEDIDCDLKTNERALAKNMPLLSEYTNYGDWATDAARWARMLRNHPASLGVDYFVNNLNGRNTSKIDVGEGGFLTHNAKTKIGEMRKQF